MSDLKDKGVQHRAGKMVILHLGGAHLPFAVMLNGAQRSEATLRASTSGILRTRWPLRMTSFPWRQTEIWILIHEIDHEQFAEGLIIITFEKIERIAQSKPGWRLHSMKT